MLAMIGQKPMLYQSIKHRKSVFYCFSPQHPLSTFLLEIAENIFFEEIYDGGLCEAAESFEDEINYLTNKEEEAKTVEKSRFVDLCALLFLLAACKIYIIKQMKKPKPCITLW